MNDGEYIRIMRPLRTGGGGREGVVVVSMVLLGWMMAREGRQTMGEGPDRWWYKKAKERRTLFNSGDK